LLSEGSQACVRPDDALVVENLSVRLQNKTILEDVGFRLRRGTTLAIVGPNGGGKTTVFKVLLNLVPHTGTVRWNGDVRMGYVPQGLVSTDLPISVEEFLKFKCKADFEACVNAVGLGKEVLSQTLGSLSGGELQRVLIAWAIVDKPNVLLLDEPTSGVDIGAEEPIYQNVKALKSSLGITTLLISHNMHVVMHYSDQVLALNKRVLFFGDAGTISHSKLLEIIYGSAPAISEEERQRE
jgi:zinc transport system ATP-binding protein